MTTKNYYNNFKYTQQLGEQAEFLAEHWAVSSSFSWAFLIMEKYYYQNEEKCKFVEQDSEIGSQNCMECELFYGVDFCESWVKCKIYSAFAEVEKLTEENKQLEKQYNMVKNICNEYLEKIKKQNKRIVHLETQIKKGAA